MQTWPDTLHVACLGEAMLGSWRAEFQRRRFKMIATMRMICNQGDKLIAEWDTDTVSPQRLIEIETEFKQRMAEGWFAVDIRDKRNSLIHQFDRNAEILLIPRVQGG